MICLPPVGLSNESPNESRSITTSSRGYLAGGWPLAAATIASHWSIPSGVSKPGGPVEAVETPASLSQVQCNESRYGEMLCVGTYATALSRSECSVVVNQMEDPVERLARSAVWQHTLSAQNFALSVPYQVLLLTVVRSCLVDRVFLHVRAEHSARATQQRRVSMHTGPHRNEFERTPPSNTPNLAPRLCSAIVRSEQHEIDGCGSSSSRCAVVAVLQYLRTMESCWPCSKGRHYPG